MDQDLLTVILAGGVAVPLLSGLLIALGRAARRCPIAGPAAGAATIGVVGSFAAISSGGILLILGWLAANPEPLAGARYFAAGLALVSAGVGFAIAASALRSALFEARRLAALAARAETAAAA